MKTIILFFALLLPVLGRIGETEQECHKRYGGDSKFEAARDGATSYEKEGIKILVEFKDEKCSVIAYVSEAGFTDEDIEKIQKSNFSGAWVKKETGTPHVKNSVTVDGAIESNYLPGSKMLILKSLVVAAASEKAAKESTKKAIDGL